MAQQGNPYLVPFGQSGMVSHPNRWRAKAGELLLAENVVVENDLVNKEPAATYYDTYGGPDSLQMVMAWSAACNWIGLTLWYAATPAATTPVFTATASLSTLGTTWTVPLTAAAPGGALHAIRLSLNPFGASATAVTDSRGNVYTSALDNVAEALAPSYPRGQIWVSVLTTALQVGDTLALTLTGSPTGVVLAASAMTGIVVPLTLRFSAPSYNTTAAVQVYTGAYCQTYPIIGIGFVSTFNTTVTADFTKSPPFQTNTVVSGGGQQMAAMNAAAFWGMTHIIAQIEFHSDETSSQGQNMSVVQGSRNVTGNFYLSYFRPGDFIVLDGEMQIVDTAPSSNPSGQPSTLITVDPWQNTHNSISYTRIAGPLLFTALNRYPYPPPAAASTWTGGTLTSETPEAKSRGTRGQIEYYIHTDKLAPTPNGRFVVGGKENAARPRKLFYLNGVDPIQVITGEQANAHAITKGAADWDTAQNPTKQPINGIVHQDSFVAFGNWNDPHRVYFSTPDDHEDFQTTAAPAEPTINFRIASNVGQRLWGAAQFQGVLFLWKYPQGIFYIDDTPSDRLQWTYRIRSMALGCAPSPYAVLATDDDVIFCDSQGHFHLLSAVATLGGTRDSDITRALGLHVWTDQNVDVASLDGMRSVYDGQTKTAWFGLRSKQAPPNYTGNNDLVIRWDFSLVAEGGPLRMTTSRVWTPNSLCLKHRDYVGRQAVLIGEFENAWFVEPGAYGRRTNHDWVANADVPQGIATHVTLPELDYGDQVPPARPRRKAFRAMELIAQQTNNDQHPVTATISVDGVYRQTLNYPQGINRRRLQPLQVGDGYAITASIQTDGSVVGDVPLIGVIYYFELLGTDQSRKS